MFNCQIIIKAIRCLADPWTHHVYSDSFWIRLVLTNPVESAGLCDILCRFIGRCELAHAKLQQDKCYYWQSQSYILTQNCEIWQMIKTTLSKLRNIKNPFHTRFGIGNRCDWTSSGGHGTSWVWISLLGIFKRIHFAHQGLYILLTELWTFFKNRTLVSTCMFTIITEVIHRTNNRIANFLSNEFLSSP